jgi:DNA repair protein RadC
MKKYKNAIKNWPKDERPREKLLKFGEHTLTNAELLAILLRSGVKGNSAVDLGRKIIAKFKSFRNLSHTDISQWKEFKGLGEAKICQIKAAIEIGRRFMTEEKKPKGKVKSSKEVADLFMPRMRDLKKEVFKVLLLDGGNNIRDIIEIDEGTVTQTTPYVREVISKALQNFSPAIVCAHNHPSGDPKPSQEDKNFTKKLVNAGKFMQVKILDHVIIGDNQYFSFADEKLINND